MNIKHVYDLFHYRQDLDPYPVLEAALAVLAAMA